MKSFTNEEYLTLCQKLVDQQYNEETLDEDSASKMEWIPTEPIAKEVIRQKADGLIDLTTVRSSEISKQLHLCTNFRCGTFKLRVKRYFTYEHGKTSMIGRADTPPKTGVYQTQYSVEVWEEKTRTPNGMPCRIDASFSPTKDDRFAGRPWLKQFNGSSAWDCNLETVVEIVRWMQALKKLSAFL